MAQHDQGLLEGFTKRYGVKQLVYFEFHETMELAIRREKQLKEWKRAWKVRLIETMNPQWCNLFDPRTGDIAEGRPIWRARSSDVEQVETCVGPGLRRDDGWCVWRFARHLSSSILGGVGSRS
jgi:putative endonuclease